MKRNYLLKASQILVLSFSLFISKALANNVQVSNVQYSSNTIICTVTWDNSWNISSEPANYDAVWLFGKYQNPTNSKWNHINISATGNSASGGSIALTVEVPSDGKGAFIRRTSSSGTNIGTVTATCTLAVNTGSTTIPSVSNFQIFAIEMVKIPSAAFYVGGSPGQYNFNKTKITIAHDSLGIAASVYSPSFGGNIPAAYPLGAYGFYCMKYEISQGQYRDFLNNLTYDQQVSRTVNGYLTIPNSPALWSGTYQYRNGIKVDSAGISNNKPAKFKCQLTVNSVNYSSEHLACNWLSWADLTAYLDWAALRPMTEFEFEKVCRGPASTSSQSDIQPVPGEYAWGTTDLWLAKASLPIANKLTDSEKFYGLHNGNCASGATDSPTINGPLRCGYAATPQNGDTAASNRVQAGASYYGVLEMSGNVGEQVIGVYHSQGYNFTDVCGDGTLTDNGSANATTWPSHMGSMLRGSDWSSSQVYTQFLQTSDRGYVLNYQYNWNLGRDYRWGGRGVRSAP